MAWRSSGLTNTDLITNLSRNHLITSSRVRSAMLRVDRAHYSPISPYEDSPQRIGFHATISAPHMHANAAEALLEFLRPGNRVLDVGSGSGYLTHVLGELGKGKVVGVEHIQALVDLSRENTGKSAEGRELMEKGILQYVRGDGRLGWEAEAPYDAIHVGAAAAGHQQRLIDQLKSPGRLFIPVEEEGLQHVYVVDKDAEGRVTKKREYGVRYVPLTDAPVE
ncbi:protein-L-isoaspartate O-methyltransferase [Sphaerulina musiva SO2202]|uniref:Protein-L-isoaspartate O-methyltransferase n=1 Tax=Sphaerulina musiva (strain SO2202) TaxID=692275 RepID=M3CYJ9_SPHMS|nr:protein-L-isoaspartate O-methyltransferase [Sphaerulina musiva SO2202]EMF08751.1 protein-L-isoaspartate O-methyltransferase [Sphaerulina musiva SO2202]